MNWTSLSHRGYTRTYTVRAASFFSLQRKHLFRSQENKSDLEQELTLFVRTQTKGQRAFCAFLFEYVTGFLSQKYVGTEVFLGGEVSGGAWKRVWCSQTSRHLVNSLLPWQPNRWPTFEKLHVCVFSFVVSWKCWRKLWGLQSVSPILHSPATSPWLMIPVTYCNFGWEVFIRWKLFTLSFGN